MADDKYEPVADGKIKEIKNTQLGIINESIREAKDHVVREVLRPMIKNYIGRILMECVSKAIEIIFGTKGNSYRDDYRDRRDEHVSYSSYYKYADRYDDRDNYARYTAKYAYWDIEFISKVKAVEVLKDLRYIIQDEGAVSLAAFFDMSGNKGMIGPNDFDWGWMGDDLRDVEIIQKRNGMWGYVRLPRVRVIPKRR